MSWGGGLPRADSRNPGDGWVRAPQGPGSGAHSLQLLQVALRVQEPLAEQLQAGVTQRVVAEVQLPQGGQGAQHAGQDPAAGLRQAAVLEAGHTWPSAGPTSRLRLPHKTSHPPSAGAQARRTQNCRHHTHPHGGGQAAGLAGGDAGWGPREGSGVPQGPEPRSDRHGSPELLDLAGGALQALEHQVHAAVAQLIGAEAELRQGGVGPERGTDVLAPHLREATVIQPADRHSVTSHSRL